MAHFNKNIQDITQANQFFRQEISTSMNSQLVLMSLKPGEDIGQEVHDVDQVLVIVSGSGEVRLDHERSKVEIHSLIIVPAGTRHNLINTGKHVMKLYTLYSPPEEQPGTVHKTKADALSAVMQPPQ